MNTHQIIVATGLALSFVEAGHADGLKPIEAQRIELPGHSGTAYYTVEREGFRVVATLGDEAGQETPLRVQVILSAGQSIAISTPGDTGSAAQTVEIRRQADDVLVSRGPTLN